MRMEDGLTIHEMIAYNKETVRIALMGGDISKRKMYMQYFGTTYRQLKEVSSWLNGNRLAIAISMLRSRVRASTCVVMAHNCWQESCGFLFARGGQRGGKRKRNAHTDEDVEEARNIDEDDDSFNIKDDPFSSEDDEEEVLADQRSPIHCNGSVNGGASWHEHQTRFQCLCQGQAPEVLHPTGRCF